LKKAAWNLWKSFKGKDDKQRPDGWNEKVLKLYKGVLEERKSAPRHKVKSLLFSVFNEIRKVKSKNPPFNGLNRKDPTTIGKKCSVFSFKVKSLSLRLLIRRTCPQIAFHCF
jgi:hypothetical protein